MSFEQLNPYMNKCKSKENVCYEEKSKEEQYVTSTY